MEDVLESGDLWEGVRRYNFHRRDSDTMRKFISHLVLDGEFFY